MSDKAEGFSSPSAKANKLMSFLQPKKNNSAGQVSKDNNKSLSGSENGCSVVSAGTQIVEIHPEQIVTPKSREGPPSSSELDKQGPPPVHKKEGPPETPPGWKSFKKNETPNYKDKKDRRVTSKYQDDRNGDRDANSLVISVQHLSNVSKEMKKKHKFCYSKEEFLAVAATLEKDNAFESPPSDAMNEYYLGLKQEYHMTELNLPSRTSRPTLPSATPSREGNRDHVKEPRPRNGSGNFGGSVDRSDHSRGKAGANGGSTKEGKWEKAAIVEGKNANAAKNTRPIANATKDSKAQDKKQSHMDQMKEFEEMRLKLRAERENKGACSGTPANGGTFHKETDGLMAEMIEASDQTPLKATETTSDSVVGNVIEQQQPVDNDVMGSLTGAMMDSLFAQPVPAPASEMNTESRSSRLFSWSAAAATPTPPNIPLVSSLTSSASNSSPSLNDLNIDSLLSASPAPVSLEPLTGGIGSLDLAGALDSLVHEEPVAPVNSVSNEFASLLLGHSNVPSQVEPVSTSSPPPKPVTSKTSQQRLQPSQQQSLRIQQLQKHQLNMQHQLQQSKASDSLNPPVSGMPIHTSAPITILQKLQVNPQSVNEAPVAPVSQVLSTSSPKRESAPVSPVSNPPHSTQNKSTVNLLSRLGIAPKSVAQSQTSVGPVAAATSGIVPMTFAQIQQQELENKTISDTTPVKAAPASTAASPFAFHTANTPVTPTSTSNTGAGSNASSNKLRKFQVLQQQKKLTTTPGKTILPKKTSPTATVQSAPVSSPGVRRVDVQGLFKKN